MTEASSYSLVMVVDLEAAAVERHLVRRASGELRREARAHAQRTGVDARADRARRRNRVAGGHDEARARLEREGRALEVVLPHVDGLGADAAPRRERLDRLVDGEHLRATERDGRRGRDGGRDRRTHGAADRAADRARRGGDRLRRQVRERAVVDDRVTCHAVGQDDRLGEIERGRHRADGCSHGAARPAERARRATERARRPADCPGEPTRQVVEHLRGRLEEEEDALLGEEPRDEGVVGLLVLHAVVPRLVRARQRPPKGDARLREHLRHDVDRRFVLKNPRLLAAAKEPHLRDQARAVLDVPVLDAPAQHFELGHDALDDARPAVDHLHRERDGLAEQGRLQDHGIHRRVEDDVKGEEPRDRFRAAEGADHERDAGERPRLELERPVRGGGDRAQTANRRTCDADSDVHVGLAANRHRSHVRSSDASHTFVGIGREDASAWGVARHLDQQPRRSSSSAWRRICAFR